MTGWISSLNSAAAGVQPRRPAAAQSGVSDRRVRDRAGPSASGPGRGTHAAACSRAPLPSQDPNDPDYRRLRYVRYADDWLLGFAGPKHEAEEIKSKIAAFLREELKLELSQSKTLITHATSQAARFLGYEIRAQHADTKITRIAGRSTAPSGCSCPGTSSGSGARCT